MSVGQISCTHFFMDVFSVLIRVVIALRVKPAISATVDNIINNKYICTFEYET